MQILFQVLLVSVSLNFSHPFFVSICEINQNKTDQTLEITVKIFSEDLENTLEEATGEKINIGMKSENENTDEYIEAYIKKTLNVTVDGKAEKLNFLGKEVEEDATWIYLDIQKVKRIKSIKVVNTILLDYENSQTNIVHLNIAGKKESMLLNEVKTSGEVSYK